MRKPLIGVTCCRREFDSAPGHFVGEKYIRGATDGADALGVLIPALGPSDIDDLLGSLDGILVTGSPSNVEPRHYNGPASAEGTLHDPHRDATTLPLIRRAIQLGVPLLGICRGHQELNVAFGGTLFQRVHEVPGRMDHREPSEATYDEKYAYTAHTVRFAEGSLLHRLNGGPEAWVNSLHWQAADKVGEGLAVEAVAPDGTIEALRVINAPAFAYSVQWHPEYKVLENPLSLALFREFGAAARARQAKTASRAA
jgi:putative glutamine amidotransferase